MKYLFMLIFFLFTSKFLVFAQEKGIIDSVNKDYTTREVVIKRKRISLGIAGYDYKGEINEYNRRTVNGLRLELIGIGFFLGAAPYSRFDRYDSLGLERERDYNEFEVNGLAIAPAGFGIKGKVQGLVLGGMINEINKVNGLMLGGVFFNEIYELNGVNINLLHCRTVETNGVQISAINRSKRLKGLHIGLINQTDKLKGVQIGLLNRAGKRWLPFINIGNQN